MLEALEGPYTELLRSRSECGSQYYCRVPICIDEEMEQIFSVIAYLEDRGHHHELGWGIHVMDAGLDTQWINFERHKCTSCVHEDIRPHVLGIAHSCIKDVVCSVVPDRICRHSAESYEWGYMPHRFTATSTLLKCCGYSLLPSYPLQDPYSGRWEWLHERV